LFWVVDYPDFHSYPFFLDAMNPLYAVGEDIVKQENYLFIYPHVEKSSCADFAKVLYGVIILLT